jgi:hypothetical protein
MSIRFEGEPPFNLGIAETASAQALEGSVVFASYGLCRVATKIRSAAIPNSDGFYSALASGGEDPAIAQLSDCVGGGSKQTPVIFATVANPSESLLCTASSREALSKARGELLDQACALGTSAILLVWIWKCLNP